MGKMNNKVVIVTGGARGIGEAITRLLIQEGAKVVVADVLDENGRALVSELGERALFERLDVRSEDEWHHVIATAESHFGPVSVLVNNAGISHFSSVEEYAEADYRRVIDINQVGVFLGMKSIVGSMRRAGGGSIVNMSSAAGLIGNAHVLAYTAAKFAVRGMTKVAAIEFGPHNIRVNSVHPGVIRSPMTIDPNASSPGALVPILDDIMKALPAGRVGEPDELAHMVLMLAGDDMRYATGSEFVMDGGLTCQ